MLLVGSSLHQMWNQFRKEAGVFLTLPWCNLLLCNSRVRRSKLYPEQEHLLSHLQLYCPHSTQWQGGGRSVSNALMPLMFSHMYKASPNQAPSEFGWMATHQGISDGRNAPSPFCTLWLVWYQPVSSCSCFNHLPALTLFVTCVSQLHA